MNNIDYAKMLMKQAPFPKNETFPCGVDQDEVKMFEERYSLHIPQDYNELLQFSNGPVIGEGGIFGIEPLRDELNVSNFYNLFPTWSKKGWIPIAGDGCGNYYVILSGNNSSSVVYFIDAHEDENKLTYIVGSSVWNFILLMLLKENGDLDWPFSKEDVLSIDPSIERIRSGVPFAWDYD